MPRLTLADLKASRIAEALNIGPTDPRLVQYINEATERLLHMGKWWGTLAKYRVCTTNGMVTLPPQIAAVEAVALNQRPIPVNDLIYEFVGHGWGTENTFSNSGTERAVYQGEFPTFCDIAGPGKRVRLICDLDEDVGKLVRVTGWDDDNNFIRTQVGGVWTDGELVPLAKSPGTLSVKNFSNVGGLQFPAMAGQSWLYEYAVATATQRMLGHYEYPDTRPSFPRWFFPAISSLSTVPTMIELLAKLAFLPVAVDSDYLVLTSKGAIKLGAMAIKAEEEHNWAEANALWYGGKLKNGNTMMGAKQLLETELSHHLGSGTQMAMNITYNFDEPVLSIAL